MKYYIVKYIYTLLPSPSPPYSSSRPIVPPSPRCLVAQSTMLALVPPLHTLLTLLVSRWVLYYILLQYALDFKTSILRSIGNHFGTIWDSRVSLGAPLGHRSENRGHLHVSGPFAFKCKKTAFSAILTIWTNLDIFVDIYN